MPKMPYWLMIIDRRYHRQINHPVICFTTNLSPSFLSLSLSHRVLSCLWSFTVSSLSFFLSCSQLRRSVQEKWLHLEADRRLAFLLSLNFVRIYCGKNQRITNRLKGKWMYRTPQPPLTNATAPSRQRTDILASAGWWPLATVWWVPWRWRTFCFSQELESNFSPSKKKYRSIIPRAERVARQTLHSSSSKKKSAPTQDGGRLDGERPCFYPRARYVTDGDILW